MLVSRTALGGAAAVVAVVVAIAAIDSGEKPAPGPTMKEKRATSPILEERSERKPGADPTSLEGAQARAAGRAVRQAYDGLADALEENILPLDVDIPTVLNAAADVPGLIQICETMSSAARKEAIDYVRVTARRGDVRWTCEKAVALLIRRVKVGGDLKPVRKAKVLAVNVDGKHATATLQFDKDAPTTSVPLVKEQGEWKIGALPRGASGDRS